jgi:hypothetical protein
MIFYLSNLLLFIFIPFVYFIQLANSIGYALSFTVCMSALLIIVISKFKIVFYKPLLYFFIFFVTYSSILLLVLEAPNYSKYILTILAILCMLVCANYFAIAILSLKLKKIINFYKMLFLLLIAMALINHFLYKDLIFSYDKAIFPNREYSHFFLHYCFFFLLFAKYYKFPISILTLLILLIIFPSLTGILVCFLIFLYYSNLHFKQLLILIILFFLTLSVVFLNLDYYSFRLINIMQNKSALTYLQGWQYIIDTLTTHPFGIGFQQMNCDNKFLFNQYSLLISNLTGTLNGHQCLDGGFNLSKLIVESGIVGIITAFIIINKSVRGFYYSIKHNFIDHSLLFNLMLAPISIDILFRNAGLLSINLFLFLTGLIGLQRIKKLK